MRVYQLENYLHVVIVSISSFQHNNPASPVDGYYVYYRATNNAGDYVKATVEGENTRSFIITHLLSDTSYDIKVQSFTIGSASDFSTIITRKTLGTYLSYMKIFISKISQKERNFKKILILPQNITE